jgi:ribosomal protein S18 acetylase RimI-like enzyme
MYWDDIPEILRIAGQGPASPWVRPDFLNVFRESETIGYVVLVRRRIAGFGLCALLHPPRTFAWNGPAIVRAFFGWLRGKACGRPRCLELFGLGVAPDCPRSDVERALLEAIVWDAGDWAEIIRAVVPETSVAAQHFLRSRGFQAVRVFRYYYGREDGYLMQRKSVCLWPRHRPGRAVGSSESAATVTNPREG